MLWDIRRSNPSARGRPAVAALVLACLLCWGAAGCEQGYQPPVVARVDGQDITLDQFVQQAAFMGLGVTPSALDRELRHEVLEGLVVQRLLLEQADRLGVKLDPAQVEARVAETREGMGQEDLNRHLVAQGLTYETWRAILSREMRAALTLETALTNETRVTAEEIARYYHEHKAEFQRPEQVLARHAVLPSREMAERLLAMTKNGADMATAAAELGSPMAERGHATWLSRGHMPDELEDQVFRLKRGMLAGPLKSAYGYHVVHVLDKRPAITLTLAQAAEEIQRRLTAQKKEELASEWLEKLRAKAKVWYDPAFLKEGKTEKVNQ